MSEKVPQETFSNELGRQSGSFFIRERDSMQERRLLVGKGLRPKTL